jgi:hypothetical protein
MLRQVPTLESETPVQRAKTEASFSSSSKHKQGAFTRIPSDPQ